ncbi:MAG TPA: gliding motility-associated C-terminal domain-containing protein [Bacteroidia bacterium]|nr:gliding motility-associated C-terminal domain-containing protein [Bacteroidia bacterium]
MIKTHQKNLRVSLFKSGVFLLLFFLWNVSFAQEKVLNECEEAIILAPDTFTPNDDDENDVLYAKSNAVSTIYFGIYDRWGHLVFGTNDLRKGWDGVYKDMKAEPGVFVWYVKGKCYNGKEFFKKGNVTLIR